MNKKIQSKQMEIDIQRTKDISETYFSTWKINWRYNKIKKKNRK